MTLSVRSLGHSKCLCLALAWGSTSNARTCTRYQRFRRKELNWLGRMKTTQTLSYLTQGKGGLSCSREPCKPALRLVRDLASLLTSSDQLEHLSRALAGQQAERKTW